MNKTYLVPIIGSGEEKDEYRPKYAEDFLDWSARDLGDCMLITVIEPTQKKIDEMLTNDPSVQEAIDRDAKARESISSNSDVIEIPDDPKEALNTNSKSDFSVVTSLDISAVQATDSHEKLIDTLIEKAGTVPDLIRINKK